MCTHTHTLYAYCCLDVDVDAGVANVDVNAAPSGRRTRRLPPASPGYVANEPSLLSSSPLGICAAAMVNFVECRAVWSYCYQAAAGLEQQSSSPATHLAFSQKVFFCFRFAGVRLPGRTRPWPKRKLLKVCTKVVDFIAESRVPCAVCRELSSTRSESLPKWLT